MRSSLEPDSRRTPIASHSWAETVPARSCPFSPSGKLPTRSSIGWSRPLAGEWERYLRQQIELGGAEVVLSKPVGRSGGQLVIPTPIIAESDQGTEAAALSEDDRSGEVSVPESRPPDRLTARPSWRK